MLVTKNLPFSWTSSFISAPGEGINMADCAAKTLSPHVLTRKVCSYSIDRASGKKKNPVAALEVWLASSSCHVSSSVHRAAVPAFTSANQFQFLGRFSRILRIWEGFITPEARRSSSVISLWRAEVAPNQPCLIKSTIIFQVSHLVSHKTLI